MIRRSFLSAEDRRHLIALARDGSAASRLTRRRARWCCWTPTQFLVDYAIGSNSCENSSGERPARTSATIWRRKFRWVGLCGKFRWLEARCWEKELPQWRKGPIPEVNGR
jgi:hypothetical protein